MSYILLNTNKTHRKNKSVILAGIPVKFDEFCNADVEEKDVEELLKQGLEKVSKTNVDKFRKLKKENLERASKTAPVSVDLHDENLKLKEENFRLNSEVTSLKVQIEELSKPEEEIDLTKYSIEKLKETSEECKVPKKDWQNMKEEALRSYLKTKLEL